MNKLAILFLSTFIVSTLSQAQNETITITECNIDTNVSQYDELFKYFVDEKEEVKHLWKFNAIDWGALNPSIALEQRIFKNSSAEFKAQISTHRLELLSFESSTQPQVVGELNGDYRFYYNIKRREKKGKLTNGFSANYFLVGNSFNFGNITYPLDAYDDFEIWAYNYHLSIGYGLQRRIGSIGYADLNFGYRFKYNIGTNKGDVYGSNGYYGRELFVDLGIGFAFKSFKRANK